MNTLDIAEAAQFLKCSEDTMRKLVTSGDIPAAKVGRAWVFLDIDLAAWLRTQYKPKIEAKKCHSTYAGQSGGLMSQSTDSELGNLLGRPTSEKRKKSTTRLSIVPSKLETMATR